MKNTNLANAYLISDSASIQARTRPNKFVIWFRLASLIWDRLPSLVVHDRCSFFGTFFIFFCHPSTRWWGQDTILNGSRLHRFGSFTKALWDQSSFESYTEINNRKCLFFCLFLFSSFSYFLSLSRAKISKRRLNWVLRGKIWIYANEMHVVVTQHHTHPIVDRRSSMTFTIWAMNAISFPDLCSWLFCFANFRSDKITTGVFHPQLKSPTSRFDCRACVKFQIRCTHGSTWTIRELSQSRSPSFC